LNSFPNTLRKKKRSALKAWFWVEAPTRFRLARSVRKAAAVCEETPSAGRDFTNPWNCRTQ